MKRWLSSLLVAGLLSGVVLADSGADAAVVTPRPDNIEDAGDAIAGVVLDIRYYSNYNFVGDPIDGYQAPKCLLTRRAVKALKTVQERVEEDGWDLKIFDCYRPQRAVDHFVRWAKDLDDTRMKGRFYPAVDKADLFDKGYIAARSGHSRGSTVDLTLVTPYGEEINMGSPYDFFDPFSHTDNPVVGEEVQANRQYLKAIMEEHGFKNLAEEWWHYTLKDEPYPGTYFDFPVE